MHRILDIIIILPIFVAHKQQDVIAMKVAQKIAQKINNMQAGTTFKYQQLDIDADEYIAAAKAIERLIAIETIKRISTGVFYKPKKTVFGEIRPGEEELIKPYLFEQNKRIAYITGLALYNRLGLTTQVPRTIKIASLSKRISINTGSIQGKPVKSYVDVNNNNYYLLELLDVLKDFTKIPDLDKKMAVKYLLKKLQDFSEKDKVLIIKYALKYPPRSRAFLGALLNKLGKQDTTSLKHSLNPFSNYKFGIDTNLLPTILKWNIK